MVTEDFKKLLLETTIASNEPVEEQNRKSLQIYTQAQKIMPSQLFRYRRCDERSLDAFYNDKVWVSSAECMNDGFDTRLFFNKKEIIEWRDNFKSDMFINALFEYFESQKEPFLKDNPLPQFEQMISIASQSSAKEKEDVAKYLQSFICEDIINMVGPLISITQQTIKFCCLSEKIGSPAMWGLYADDEKGFALEYDCRDLFIKPLFENGYNRTCSCLPIIYSDNRFQVPTDFITSIFINRWLSISLSNSGYSLQYPQDAQTILNKNICPDILVPTKIALHKSNEWKQEAEWRLFCSSNNDWIFNDAKHASFTLKAKGVYLGRRISSIYEKIILDIAHEKNIPVFKMHINDDSPSYELIPIRL